MPSIGAMLRRVEISIRASRMRGDVGARQDRGLHRRISIRASRMRGDQWAQGRAIKKKAISIRASRMRGDSKFDTSHLTM